MLSTAPIAARMNNQRVGAREQGRHEIRVPLVAHVGHVGEPDLERQGPPGRRASRPPPAWAPPTTGRPASPGVRTAYGQDKHDGTDAGKHGRVDMGHEAAGEDHSRPGPVTTGLQAPHDQAEEHQARTTGPRRRQTRPPASTGCCRRKSRTRHRRCRATWRPPARPGRGTAPGPSGPSTTPATGMRIMGAAVTSLKATL